MKKGITIAIIVIALLFISFFSTAGLWRLACWAFGLDFSWKASIGVWAVLWLIGSVFKTGK